MDDPILQKSYFKKLLQARTLTYKTVRKPMKANEKFTLHIVNHFTIEKLRTTAKMYGMPTINNNGQRYCPTWQIHSGKTTMS